MVKYLDGDFGPEHFSKDFGFTDSAYQSRADHNRRARQKNGVADNDAAVGEGDGTYVSRSHGGRLHRAMGGIAQQTITPTNRPTGDQTSPGGEMLGGATVTMPAINMARAADRMVQMGRGQGAREAMAMQGAHMPPGATQSLVANPPVHTPGIPGLKKGGRAPAGQHPKGVLLIIAGRPTGAPMKPVHRAKGGRMCAADGGPATAQEAWDRESADFRKNHPEAYSGRYQPTNSMNENPKPTDRAHGGRLTAKERHALPRGDFALPGHGEGSDHKGSGSYPIPDQSHARAALSRVAQHGSPAEQEKVRSAVHRKYPDIGKR